MLYDVQERMHKLGVRDVKIFFDRSVHMLAPSIVKSQVAFLLSTYLDGYKEELPRFNDGADQLPRP